MLNLCKMIRTTVRFEEDLFKDARKKAIDQGIAFAEIINNALREYLKGSHKKAVYKKIKFGAYHLGKIKGSLRRVDIYDDI